jgi:hypothetical protein
MEVKMRNTKIVLLLIVFMAGLVGFGFVQAQMKAPKVAAAQLQTFTGTISKITPADPAKKMPAGIVAVGADQKEVTFALKSKAVIHDADGKPTTLDKLKVNDKVEIKYHTDKAGINVAESIKIVM